MAAPVRRFEPSASVRPSWRKTPRRFVSLPPSVRRLRPVPSGRTRYTCAFIPPPGAREKAIHVPSGDHSTLPTGSSKEVTSRGKPPAAGTVHTCGTPPRLETKATVLPSGEKLGDREKPTRDMRETAVSRSSAAGNVAAGRATFAGEAARRISSKVKRAAAHAAICAARAAAAGTEEREAPPLLPFEEIFKSFPSFLRIGRPHAHEERVEAARGEKPHEPRVVVEGPHRGDHEAAPGEEAARERRDDGGGIPPAVRAVREVERAQVERPPPDDPVVGDEDARDGPESARVPEEPREDVALRVREEPPGLHRDADEAGDEAAGLEADEPRQRVREVVRGGDDVRRDVDGERRDDDREHRDGDDDGVREPADELDGVPDRLAEDDGARARDEDAHRGEREHRRRERDDLAQDLLPLAAAEAREVRHVEGQRRPEPDHRREGRDEDGEELCERVELPGLREERPEALRLPDRPDEEDERHGEDVRGGPVLDLPEEVHSAVDDEDVQAPEEEKREPLGRRVSREAGAEERRPARNDGGEERVEGLAADPGLDAEPAARDERAHEGGQVRARRPVG